MRTGIDTSFRNRPSSGIATYLASLHAAIARDFPEIELIDLQPAPDSPLNRLGARGSRFAWETVGAGISARRQKLDLLHMPMMATPILAGAPVVTTVHDVIPFVMPEYRESRSQQINLRVVRHAIRRASAIITPSHHAASDVITVLGVPRDRVWVTWEAADEQFRPAVPNPSIGFRLRSLGVTGPYIFNVGGLDVRKNLATLCRAFAQVLPRLDREIQLVIAGAPHSANARVFPPLEPVIRELGIENRVLLTGRVSEEDKLLLMQHADLYVTPSLYEGFGLTALEAMACGIPVVASNRTSLPEVVGDGGLLVEPRVPEFAEAIASVLTNRDLAADLGRRGLARSQQFSWVRTAAQTVDVYRHVLRK